MTTLDLTHLETLLAAATPGPWVYDEACILNKDGDELLESYSDLHPREDLANRKLIVALRNAAPALIARVRELENPQIATVIDPDTGFTINGPEWLQLPLKARLIIQELSLQKEQFQNSLKRIHRRAQKAERRAYRVNRLFLKWKGNAEFWHREFFRHHGIDVTSPVKAKISFWNRLKRFFKHLPKPPTE